MTSPCSHDNGRDVLENTWYRKHGATLFEDVCDDNDDNKQESDTCNSRGTKEAYVIDRVAEKPHETSDRDDGFHVVESIRECSSQVAVH